MLSKPIKHPVPSYIDELLCWIFGAKFFTEVKMDATGERPWLIEYQKYFFFWNNTLAFHDQKMAEGYMCYSSPYDKTFN